MAARRLSDPADRGHPSLAPVAVEVVLEPCFLDRLHLPSGSEGIPDLLLGNPPRPAPVRLFVAEGEHEVPPSLLHDRAQVPLEDQPAFIGQSVKEAAVDGRVEPPPQFAEPERVPELEICAYPPRLCLLLRLLYRQLGRVDPQDPVALCCHEQNVLSCPAPDVQYVPQNSAVFFE